MIISAGLGENQTTDFIRIENKAKGYTKGQPDFELKCNLGSGFTDVVAIELKNPIGSVVLVVGVVLAPLAVVGRGLC